VIVCLIWRLSFLLATRCCLFIHALTQSGVVTNIVVCFFLPFYKKSWTVDGTPGPVGPTAGRIVNIIVAARAPALHPPTEANIASAVTWCRLIAPAECVEVCNDCHHYYFLFLLAICPLTRNLRSCKSKCHRLANNLKNAISFLCVFFIAAGGVRADDLDSLDEGECRLSSFLISSFFFRCVCEHCR
jgi:hypothetical protein